MKVKFPAVFNGRNIIRVCREVAEEKGLEIKVGDLFGDTILNIDKDGKTKIDKKPYEFTKVDLLHREYSKPKFLITFQLNELDSHEILTIEILNPNTNFVLPLIENYFSIVSQKLYSEMYSKSSS